MAELSLQNQIRLSNLELSSQLMQGTFSTISKINGAGNPLAAISTNKNSGKLVYAAEGDSKYKEELDSNNDGVITYNEYIKHVTDSLSSKNNIPKLSTYFKNEEDSETGLRKFTVTNLSKVLTSYLNANYRLPIGFIEEEV